MAESDPTNEHRQMQESRARQQAWERVRQQHQPRAAKLEAHPYVARAEDVSFGGGRELLEVSFRGMIPESFTRMDEIAVLTCWVDTLPGLWGTVLGEERARKYGLGSDCLTALVEVSNDA